MQGIVDEERQRDHPHPPSARRVATGHPCLGCCSSSPMSPHRLVVALATNIIGFMEWSTKHPLAVPVLGEGSTGEFYGAAFVRTQKASYC